MFLVQKFVGLNDFYVTPKRHVKQQQQLDDDDDDDDNVIKDGNVVVDDDEYTKENMHSVDTQTINTSTAAATAAASIPLSKKTTTTTTTSSSQEDNWNAFMRTKSTVFLSSLATTTTTTTTTTTPKKKDEVSCPCHSITVGSSCNSCDNNNNNNSQTSMCSCQYTYRNHTPKLVMIKSTVQKTRFATALFRLIYSSIVLIFTIGAFQGSSSSYDTPYMNYFYSHRYNIANVWRLSSHGNITCLFPTTNSQYTSTSEDKYAKYFYMLQISYHTQSVCFQIWLMSLAWLVNVNSNSKSKNQKGEHESWFTKFVSIGAGYRKSLLFHSTSITVLMLSYLFSSTRRLTILVLFYM